MKEIKRIIRRICSFIIERVAYYSGLNSLFYLLNRNAKRVITFHHVFPDELLQSVTPDCLFHSVSDFKKIVAQLGRYYKFSLDLNDAKSVTLTFDDGYQSQYDCAFKVLSDNLSKNSVVGYIFVSGKLVNGKRALIVDLLTAWCRYAPEEYTGANRSDFWENEIWPKYLQDASSHGKNILRELDAKYPLEKMLASLPLEYRRLRFEGLTVSMLEEMKATGWGIGGHGYTHYPLGYLTAEESEKDIKSGAVTLKPYQTTNVYSYPFGGENTIGKDAQKVLRDIGASCAVANEIHPMWTTDIWHIPRMALSANKYAFHFELSGCKYFFKHHKLLPIVKV